MTTDTTARLKLDDNIVMQFGNKLYSQEMWWVILREIIQNALDAKAKNISITCNGINSLTVVDDGIGMSKETLLNTFLTVGGSDKRSRDESTVGGFGIAKLAIFACDDFSVMSGDYHLSKQILVNHKKLEKLDEPISGTRVMVRKKDLFGYFSSSRDEVSEYLGYIDRDVNIFLNGSRVEKFHFVEISVDQVKEPVKSCTHNFGSTYAHILVRANGLPVFKNTSYSIENSQAYIYDVHTSLDPYDTKYPLTMTRDAFNGDTSEANDFNKFFHALTDHFRKIKIAEQKLKDFVSYDERTGYYIQYGAVINENTIALMQKFHKYIELLYNLKTGYLPHERFGIGIVGDNNNPDKETGGSYFFDEERNIPVYMIHESAIADPYILGVAIHEFSHRKHPDHYDGFANEVTTNTICILGSILEGKKG